MRRLALPGTVTVGSPSSAERGGAEPFKARGGAEPFKARGGDNPSRARSGAASFRARSGAASFRARSGAASFRARSGAQWQIVVADLALILFLAAAAALAARSDGKAQAINGEAADTAAISQAIYRPGPGLPSLGDWLAEIQMDPRARLTIRAVYAPGDEDAAWRSAREMERQAHAQGVSLRTILIAGSESRIEAHLAFEGEARQGESAAEP